jgi:predicted kinase
MLYGPPAVGKLTIAKELVGLVGLRLVDNHTTGDPARALFDFGTTEYFDLAKQLTLLLCGAAARAGISVVSTLVFAHPEDRSLVSEISAEVASQGALFSAVQLTAPLEVLEVRVGSGSRIGTKKIVDPAVLHRTLSTWDLTRKIHDDDLSFDTSLLSAAETAGEIAIGLDLIPN